MSELLLIAQPVALASIFVLPFFSKLIVCLANFAYSMPLGYIRAIYSGH
ncbi:MAG: hypothetical protein ACXW09_04250 [Methylococcaceae bacterium]